jgi:hypothetical protein
LNWVEHQILGGAGGANFEHFGVANWPPKFDGILCFFQPWGQYEAIKVQHLLILGGRLKSFFFYFSLDTPSVMLLGLISTFAPIGMLDFG